jgi:hypothetical protein
VSQVAHKPADWLGNRSRQKLLLGALNILHVKTRNKHERCNRVVGIVIDSHDAHQSLLQRRVLSRSHAWLAALKSWYELTPFPTVLLLLTFVAAPGRDSSPVNNKANTEHHQGPEPSKPLTHILVPSL